MHLHFNPGRPGYLARVPSRSRGGIGDFPLAQCVGLRRLPGGMPTVASQGRPLHRSGAGAANPQGNGRLDRLGREVKLREIPTLALITGQMAGPELLHDVHALVGERAPLPHGDAQGLELLGHGAHADAQSDPAAGYLVQRGGVLGQLNRVVIRQHQHRSAQGYLRRGGRQEREGGHGVVVGLVFQPLTDVSGVEQVVHNPDRVETQTFRQRPELQDLLRVVDAPVVGNGHTNLHSALLMAGIGMGSRTA